MEIPERKKTLWKILDELDENDLVLVDASAVHDFSVSISREFEGKPYSSMLDTDILRKTISANNRFLRILHYPCTHVIHEVSQEISRLHGIINRKNKSLSHRNKGESRKNQEYLEEVARTMSAIQRHCESNHFKIPDPRYSVLLDMVKLIEKYCHLKKPSALNLCTDEKLSAALLWASMAGDKIPGILTRDRDFVHIISGCSYLMERREFMPYNRSFLNRNESVLYYPRENDFVDVLAIYPSGTNIRRLDPKDYQALRDEMHELWKIYSKI